jgi:hypothetical protein
LLKKECEKYLKRLSPNYCYDKDKPKNYCYDKDKPKIVALWESENAKIIK